jgi:hypothetical protein
MNLRVALLLCMTSLTHAKRACRCGAVKRLLATMPASFMYVRDITSRDEGTTSNSYIMVIYSSRQVLERGYDSREVLDYRQTSWPKLTLVCAENTDAATLTRKNLYRFLALVSAPEGTTQAPIHGKAQLELHLNWNTLVS